jgi:hypothetical protein
MGQVEWVHCIAAISGESDAGAFEYTYDAMPLEMTLSEKACMSAIATTFWVSIKIHNTFIS